MGDTARPRVEEKPRPKVTVNLSTGCVSAKHELREWLDVRDPAGVIRRLLLASGAATRPARLNDCKDAQPEAEMTLESAVSAPTRMLGRDNARYINVGFRCVRALWPLNTPAEEALKAPAK